MPDTDDSAVQLGESDDLGQPSLFSIIMGYSLPLMPAPITDYRNPQGSRKGYCNYNRIYRCEHGISPNANVDDPE